MVREEVEADGVGGVVLQGVADEHEVAERLAHLLAVVADHRRRASRCARTARRRRRSRTGRSRTRGGGRSDRRRRRGCRCSARGSGWPSPSTRCASPAGPVPTASPRTARRAADFCQRTKSSGSRLLGSSGVLPRSLAMGSISSRGMWLSLPNSGSLLDREVDVAAALVGVALVDQRLDDLEHLGDVVGGADVMIGLEPVEVAHVLEVARRLAVAELVPGRGRPLWPCAGCRRRCR